MTPHPALSQENAFRVKSLEIIFKQSSDATLTFDRCAQKKFVVWERVNELKLSLKVMTPTQLLAKKMLSE